MKIKPRTLLQEQVLSIIEDRNNWTPPSIRKIAVMLDINHWHGVHIAIDNLIKRGDIDKNKFPIHHEINNPRKKK